MKQAETNTWTTIITNKAKQAKAFFLPLFLFTTLSLFSNEGSVSYDEENDQFNLSVELPDELFDETDEEAMSELMTKMSVALSPILVDLNQLFIEMASDLTKLVAGFEFILDTENLCNPNRVLYSKSILDPFRKKLGEYEKQFKEELAQVNAKFKDSYKEEPDILMGLKLGVDTFCKPYLDYFKVVGVSYAKIDNLLNFLTSIQGEFWESNDQICFRNDADDDTYFSLLQDLQDHLKQEAVVLKALRRGL